eukprot:Nk52_evm34s279 gene=Nk52_evmTU34s279
MSGVGVIASGARRAVQPLMRQQTRQLSEYVAQREAESKHAAGTYGTWRTISYVCVPTILATAYIAFSGEHDHHMNPEMPHLRIRSKPFPWGDGDKSLFHNPHVNT